MLFLWASTVAQRMGFDYEEAASLAGAVAGSYWTHAAVGRQRTSADQKMVSGYRENSNGYEFEVVLLDCICTARMTADGIRAVDEGEFTTLGASEQFLVDSFGSRIVAINEAMNYLANSYAPDALALAAATLYERFRPRRGQALNLNRIIWAGSN